MSDLKRTELSVKQERAVLVGVILPGSTADPRDPLGELAALAKTAGAKVVGTILQKRHRIDAGMYIGSGKAIEVAQMVKENQADVVIFDNDLSPAQIGSLEKAINEEIGSRPGEGVKVLDRSELILDIFATRAQTHEAKLQVELAQMQYTYPRLTRMWGHLERLAGGGIGTRGPGEQQLEIDRRLVRKRIGDLKAEIAKVQERKTRLVSHRNRDFFTVCIVGYTNAGKSTLFNTLTAAGTYADNKLFATLDTKTRAWEVDKGALVLLSDTVGFVRDLPHNLVASFKATLEEAIYADLLLHVLDVGHPHAQQQFESVNQVLEEVGVKGKDQILLLNKVDTESGAAQFPVWRALHPDAIAISAKTGSGLTEICSVVDQRVRGQQVQVKLEVASTDGKAQAYIQTHAQVHSREFIDGRVVMDAHVGRHGLMNLSRQEGIHVLSYELPTGSPELSEIPNTSAPSEETTEEKGGI